MNRGFGFLLMLAGSGLLLNDGSRTEARSILGPAVLLLLTGTGLLAGWAEEDLP